MSRRRKVVVSIRRRITLMKVGKFLRKGYEIRDLQGNIWKVFKEAYFIRKLKKCSEIQRVYWTLVVRKN